MQYATPDGPVEYVTPDGPVEYVTPDGPAEYVEPDGPVGYVTPGGASGYSEPEPGGTYTYREDPAACFTGSADAQAAGDEPPAVAGADEPAPADVSAPQPASSAVEPEPAHDIEPELLPAYDAGRGPQPYVAPRDPHTGAQTEPFRGPFEPHPAQPKLSELADPAAPPAVLTPYSELSRARTVPAEDAVAVADPAEDAVAVAGPAVARGEPAYEGSEEKLEKIRDLYLTVEAIGDDNVDKHFDELLQRQRELISDYFKETGIGTGKAPTAEPDQPHNN